MLWHGCGKVFQWWFCIWVEIKECHGIMFPLFFASKDWNRWWWRWLVLFFIYTILIKKKIDSWALIFWYNLFLCHSGGFILQPVVFYFSNVYALAPPPNKIINNNKKGKGKKFWLYVYTFIPQIWVCYEGFLFYIRKRLK